MKITAIVNGISAQAEACLADLNGLKTDVEVRVTQAQGNAEILTTDACNAGSDLIISCGGDGTLNECLNGLLNSSNPNAMLALYPIGSANDFARITGNAKLVQIVDCAQSGTFDSIVPVDMVWEEGNRHFLNISAAGIGAEIATEFNRRRFSMPHTINYYTAILQWLAKYRAPRLRIRTESLDRTTRSYLAAIGRGVYAGNGLALLPQNKLRDTQIGMTIAGNINVIDFIRYQGKLKKGKFLKDKRFQYSKADTVEIEVLEGSMAIDGDGEFLHRFKAGEKVTYAPASKSIRFILPNLDEQLLKI